MFQLEMSLIGINFSSKIHGSLTRSSGQHIVDDFFSSNPIFFYHTELMELFNLDRSSSMAQVFLLSFIRSFVRYTNICIRSRWLKLLTATDLKVVNKNKWFFLYVFFFLNSCAMCWVDFEKLTWISFSFLIKGDANEKSWS